MKMRILILTLMILALVSCKSLSNLTGINKKTCLVLSVGGPKGIAHIGAIQAIKERKIKIDCIYGNSMGAVIGGLYAFKPNKDLREQYREVIGNYIEKTKNDKLFSGFILGGAALILSGGLLGWETLAASFTGILLTEKFSNSRFEIVLNKIFENKNIENTEISFATSYQMKNGHGLDLIISQNENLAHAISKSANNPFIFSNTSFTKIDPGADRLAAIPIDDTCNYFNPTMIIVINVTGNEPIWSDNMNCPVIIINIRLDDRIDYENVMKATGKDFEKVLETGYNTTLDKL